jgi:hypothetical protein
MQIPDFSYDDERIGQENENDFSQQNQNKFSEAVLWSTDWTTETIITQLKKKNIELYPNFQRRDAWGADRKCRFIESIILGLPIPQIILAERKDKKGSYIVIDGKQRLLSIRQFCVTQDDEDFSPLKISGLKILNNLNNNTYRQMSEDPDFNDYKNAFDNQSIRTIVIKNWPSQEFLYTVFLRLNTGSLPLSPQELRQALMPGPFTVFADTFSIESEQIKKALGIKKPDYRMRDVEIVVRFFAFKNYIEAYSGNLKSFLDTTCEKLNIEFEKDNASILHQASELERAIDMTFQIFGENAFNKYSGYGFTGIFNRPVFDIMTYFFSVKEIREATANCFELIVDVFKELCTQDIEFLRSLETSTKDVNAVAKRFSKWGECLSHILKMKILIPQKADVGIKLI